MTKIKMSHPNLNVKERAEAHRIINEFLSKKIPLLSIPAWVVVGKRCQKQNVHGQCTEAVYDKNPFCFACREVEDR